MHQESSVIDMGYIVTAVVSAAIGIWYGHSWGRDDGRAEGYEDGRTVGLLESNSVAVARQHDGGITILRRRGEAREHR